MSTRVTVKPCPYMGKRVNLTPESDIPEEVKIAAAETRKAERRQSKSRALAVWGTVLVGLPFVLPLGYWLGMALVHNQQALAKFSALTDEEKRAFIAGVHGIDSRQEMRAYVDRFAER